MRRGMSISIATSWLAHPLTRGMSVDDPRTTEIRRRIIRQKPFLRKIYQQWYAMIASAMPESGEPALELGSGAGFMRELVPNLITSDVFACPGVDVVLDATDLPFRDESLRAIAMTDVLHHISQPRRFFAEATRCVRPGGVIAAIEPWVTPFSRLIYGRFHHEPFMPAAQDWEFPTSGPLSGANGAMPWMIFQRDRAAFQCEFPKWEIVTLRPFMPFRYVLSGGVSMRSLMPGFSFGFWRGVEAMLDPFRDQLAMFVQITLRRRENS
jgi:SAM-dependent methyltransferase